MATIYSKERSKYGNITGQIIIWPVEVNGEIDSASMKRDLPAGYLRCDGTVYNAEDFPQLAAICGTGTGGKYVRRDLSNNPLQSVSDEQFVVPDLGSKYPLPTGSKGGGGQYINVRITTEQGVEKSRSGIGIDADDIAGTNGVIDVQYTGNFIVPSHDIPMRGRPSYTLGTESGKRTEVEAVDNSAIHGHAHFHQGTRTRLKANGEIDEDNPSTVLEPEMQGPVALRNASTVPVWKWMLNTTDPMGTNWPGNGQGPCKAIVSGQFASDYEFRWGNYSGTGSGIGGVIASNPTAYSGGCWNGSPDIGKDLKNTWKYWCISPTEEYMKGKLEAAGLTVPSGISGGSTTTTWTDYPITDPPYSVNGTYQSKSRSNTWTFLFGCQTPRTTNINNTQNLRADYVQGAQGVPEDWKGDSWYQFMPLQRNDLHSFAGEEVYPGLFNEFTETDPLYTGGEDPTEHFHKVNINKEDHTFELRTDAHQIAADLLETKLQLDVDESRSVDNVSSPFIILEYLIKI